MLDLSEVAGGGTLGQNNAEQERPYLAAKSGKDRAHKAGRLKSRGGQEGVREARSTWEGVQENTLEGRGLAPHHRAEWLDKITEAGVRRRAERYYQQLDGLRLLRQEVRRDLLVESKKHKASKLLRQIPGIGPIRAALLIALMQTPHRFRTKRELWNYSGLGLETHDSGQYRAVEGQLQRWKRPGTLRGLNKDLFVANC
jgi:transposase